MSPLCARVNAECPPEFIFSYTDSSRRGGGTVSGVGDPVMDLVFVLRGWEVGFVLVIFLTTLACLGCLQRFIYCLGRGGRAQCRQGRVCVRCVPAYWCSISGFCLPYSRSFKLSLKENSKGLICVQ